jgi:hypothetical protein
MRAKPVRREVVLGDFEDLNVLDDKGVHGPSSVYCLQQAEQKVTVGSAIVSVV